MSNVLNILITSSGARTVISDLSAIRSAIGTFVPAVASTAGALAALKGALDLGGHIADFASQAGLSAQALQTFSAIGAESGLTMEDIAKAAEKLRNSLQDARQNGASPLNAALGTLRLSAVGLQAIAPERQWEEIARAVANATDKQAALNAASDLLGQKNLPRLKELLDRLGTEGYDRLFEATSKLRISDANLKTLDDAGDKLTRIVGLLKTITAKATAEALASNIVAQVAQAAAISSRILLDPGSRINQHIQEEKQKAERKFNDPRAEQAAIVRDNNERARAAARQELMRDANRAEQERRAAIAETTRETVVEAESVRAETALLEASQQSAAAVVASVTTPLETYNEELRKLKRLLDENLLTQEEFNRAVDAAGVKLATAKTIPEAERALNAQLLSIAEARNRLEADFTRTAPEKWEARKALIQQEIDARKQVLTLLQAMREGVSSDEARVGIDQRISGVNEQLIGLQGQLGASGADPNSWLQQMQASLTALRESWGTTAQQIAGSITGTIGSAVDAMSSSISGLILGTKSWGSALSGVANSILTSVVNAVVQLGVRWIATQLLMATAGKAIAAAATASTAPIALAQSAIWAAPATLATIASFGAAAAAAPVEIAGAIGMTELLSLFSGFAGGGPVGGGKQLAWLNEEGSEFVFSAPAVRALGMDTLNAMHQSALSPGGSAAVGVGGAGRESRVLVVDHREEDLISRLLADPRFETKVRRIGRRHSGDFGSPT